MASTGKTRLQDKHANKRAKVAKITDAVLEPESTLKKPVKAGKTNVPLDVLDVGIPVDLKDDERPFYLALIVKLQDLYDDTEKLSLAALNLAKLYAFGQRLEREIEKDGGMILSNSNGNLYMHPAMKALQTNQSQIMQHLKLLGIQKKSTTDEKNKEPAHISAFAKFQ